MNIDETKLFSIDVESSFPENNSYVKSYEALKKYFTKEPLDSNSVICGAHMVYGWMPTILHMDKATCRIDTEEAAGILNSLKENPDKTLSDVEINKLKGMLNNSLVGTSKFLHFLSPEKYAIWDSNICSYILDVEKPSRSGYIERLNNFTEYHEELHRIKNLNNFDSFHERVSEKLAYNVSPLRAIEIVMFFNSPSYKKEK